MGENNNGGLKISKRTFIITVAILLAIMMFAGVLTQILPQGSYQRTLNEFGQEVVVDGTYVEHPDAQKLPIWRWFLAPFEVFGDSDSAAAIVIIIFIILVGGTFTVLEKSGVFNYVIAATIKRFGARKYALIAVLSLICMLMGSTMGLLEETVPLVPIIVALALALGFDTLTGLGMSILAVGFGFAAGTFNPFTVVIAQRVAGVEIYSGLWLRACIFVVVYGLLMLFLLTYAKKIEKNPEKSLVYQSDLARRARYSYENDLKFLENKRVKIAAVIFGAALGLIFIYIAVALLWSGLGLSDYTMPVMAVLITAGGLIAGKVSGYKRKGLAKDFFIGLLNILPAIVPILLALGAKHIMVTGGIMDTILYNAYHLIQNTSPYVAALLIYLFVLVIEFFISGAASKAFLIMPIIAPLADLIGLTRQSAVLAFLFGDGFTNVFFPTCALLLIVLGLMDVPYSKWFKWIWKVQLSLLVVTAAILMFSVAIGYN